MGEQSTPRGMVCPSYRSGPTLNEGGGLALVGQERATQWLTMRAESKQLFTSPTTILTKSQVLHFPPDNMHDITIQKDENTKPANAHAYI